MVDSHSDSDTVDSNFDSELDQSLRVKASERGKQRIRHTEHYKETIQKCYMGFWKKEPSE